MRRTDFLEACCKLKSDTYYEDYVERNARMTLPVIMGITTKERIEYMTADEIGIVYQMAVVKRDIVGGGGNV